MNEPKIENNSQWNLKDLIRETSENIINTIFPDIPMKQFERKQEQVIRCLNKFIHRMPPGQYKFDYDEQAYRNEI